MSCSSTPPKRKDLNIYCSMDSFVHHMHHSFLTHSFLPFFMAQEILINKLHTVFNTVVLDPGKYEHVFLSQVLTLVSRFMEFTRILMSDFVLKLAEAALLDIV